MLPWEHFLLALFPMIHLWQAVNPIFAMTFVIANVLIDLDHYFLVLYANKFKMWNFKRVYEFFALRHGKEYHVKAIYIFHTIEFFILICILYLITNWIYLLAIIFAIVYHLLLDFAETAYFKHVKKRNEHYKPISIILFLIRK